LQQRISKPSYISLDTSVSVPYYIGQKSRKSGIQS
jgi:hypothetical protein